MSNRAILVESLIENFAWVNHEDYLQAHKIFNAAYSAALESKEVQGLRDALEEIINCPQSVDEATIPAGGVEVNPAQVILMISVSLVRIRKARAALAQKQGEKHDNQN